MPVSRRHLLLVGLGIIILPGCERKTTTVRRTIDLLVESDGDQLAFKPTELTCPTGARVRLTFKHTGKYVSFEHNWVLIRPHTFDEVNKAALAAGEKNGWVPKDDPNVIAATPLCTRGQQATIEFIAPAPGDYLFICTNPGHAQSMWGVLHVTAA
jgi:azurin